MHEIVLTQEGVRRALVRVCAVTIVVSFLDNDDTKALMAAARATAVQHINEFSGKDVVGYANRLSTSLDGALETHKAAFRNAAADDELTPMLLLRLRRYRHAHPLPP